MFLSNPLILLLALVAAVAVFWARKRNLSSGFKFSSGDLLGGLPVTWKIKINRYLIFFRLIAIILLIIALSRPQSPIEDSKIETEGIDIVLAIDSSTSMLAEDFKIAGKRWNRIDIVKKVVGDFVKGRQNDRIGIVTFASRAYTVCPLTLDYGWLLSNLERIKCGMVEDGTAIGSGISTSLNRLKNTPAKSKIIVLLTDGRNNTGKIPPLTAAEAAKALKVKIYTIGAGSKGPVPYPVRDLFGNSGYQNVEIDLDEDTLTRIASITGGRYYRATDAESLKKIYGQIDQLEKTPVAEKGYQEYRELFPYFLIPALVLILLEIVLTNTLLRKLP